LGGASVGSPQQLLEESEKAEPIDIPETVSENKFENQ
jgi:hypothetical protein